MSRSHSVSTTMFEGSARYTLTGQRVAGYLVGELIGFGGMGEVYEATLPDIGKRAALKVLSADRCVDKENVKRFLSEARAVNSIGHRNIVDIFAVGELPDGSHYLLMEYLDGMAFDELISKRAPLPPVEALNYVEQVLEALAAAHAAGVVHRDVKPSNVFLCLPRHGKPYVKLLDFGAAKLGAASSGLTPASPVSLVIGTPTYMAPEQVLGHPIGPTSDLYGVGGLLFELLTGREVFPAATPFEVMRRHAQDQPPRPSSLVSTVPRAVDQLVLALLRKKPTDRPRSADIVRRWCESIRAMTDGLDTTSDLETAAYFPALDLNARRLATPLHTLDAPVQPFEPATGGARAAPRRRPGRAAVMALSLGAMLTVGVAGWSFGRPEAAAATAQLMVPPPPAVAAKSVAPAQPAAVAGGAKPSRGKLGGAANR